MSRSFYQEQLVRSLFVLEHFCALSKTAVIMAQWYIHLDSWGYCPMTHWEHNVLEEAVRQGHDTVAYHWEYNGDPTTRNSYNLDLRRMVQVNVDSGKERGLLRITDMADHARLSPFRGGQ